MHAQVQQVAGITIEEDEVEQSESPMVSDEGEGEHGDDPEVSDNDDEGDEGIRAGRAEEGPEQERLASGARAEASGRPLPAKAMVSRLQQGTAADAELQVAPSERLL